MLQEFLNQNFLTVTDDINFEKLKKATDEVVKKLSKSKNKIVSYTLVALDPEIQADNPDIFETQEIIIKHWSTFVANAKDTPIVFIRAVMLESLEIISKEINYATLIWLTGRNIIQFYKLGREKDLLCQFLLSLGERVETDAVSKWSFIHKEERKKIEGITLGFEPFKTVSIDKSELEKHLKAAALHSGWGQGGENPMYPSYNDSRWPDFFAQRASKGITDIINNAFKKQTTEILAFQTTIQEKINSMVLHIEEMANKTFQEDAEKNYLFQIRTQLLWWKEALYSSYLRKSYRELNFGLLEIALAYDYSSLVPYIYPSSVDFFLKETHNTIVHQNENKVKISDLVNSIQEEGDSLKQLSNKVYFEGSRVPMMKFILGVSIGQYSAGEIESKLGVPKSSEISLGDFTAWVFHDFQAQKILK